MVQSRCTPKNFFCPSPARFKFCATGFSIASCGCCAAKKLEVSKICLGSRDRLRLVGRPGFEPGLSASKALDLPLVDRPVFCCHCRVTEATSANLFDRLGSRGADDLKLQHRAPIFRARQGLGEESLRAGRLDTLLSGASVCVRPVKSKQRRTGARECRVDCTAAFRDRGVSDQITLG